MIGNKRGQMVIESILIMIVLVAVVGALQATLKKSEAFKTLVQGPWLALSGMIQAGDWNKPEVAMNFHPSLHKKQSSVVGTRKQ